MLQGYRCTNRLTDKFGIKMDYERKTRVSTKPVCIPEYISPKDLARKMKTRIKKVQLSNIAYTCVFVNHIKQESCVVVVAALHPCVHLLLFCSPLVLRVVHPSVSIMVAPSSIISTQAPRLECFSTDRLVLR